VSSSVNYISKLHLRSTICNNLHTPVPQLKQYNLDPSVSCRWTKSGVPCHWTFGTLQWPMNGSKTNSKLCCSVKHITQHSKSVAAQAARIMKVETKIYIWTEDHRYLLLGRWWNGSQGRLTLLNSNVRQSKKAIRYCRLSTRFIDRQHLIAAVVQTRWFWSSWCWRSKALAAWLGARCTTMGQGTQPDSMIQTSC